MTWQDGNCAWFIKYFYDKNNDLIDASFVIRAGVIFVKKMTEGLSFLV